MTSLYAFKNYARLLAVLAFASALIMKIKGRKNKPKGQNKWVKERVDERKEK